MATPFVAGVVSLLVGLHPDWSAEQLVQRVIATAKPLASLAGRTVSGGMVDAAQAVGVAGSGPDGDHYTGPPVVQKGPAKRVVLHTRSHAPTSRKPLHRPVKRKDARRRRGSDTFRRDLTAGPESRVALGTSLDLGIPRTPRRRRSRGPAELTRRGHSS